MPGNNFWMRMILQNLNINAPLGKTGVHICSTVEFNMNVDSRVIWSNKDN